MDVYFTSINFSERPGIIKNSNISQRLWFFDLLKTETRNCDIKSKVKVLIHEQ